MSEARTKRVILVFGHPGNGKSTVAGRLRSEHDFRSVSADDVYVRYVQTHCPAVFFPALSQCILQHYDEIFRQNSAEVDNWHDHLLNEIIQASGAGDDVVVEGYLLYDCKDKFEVALKEQGLAVFQIRMERFGGILEQPRLTVQEIAALGTSSPRKRR